MNKVKVEICCGTACYLLGAAHLMELEASLPDDLKGRVEFEAKTCLRKCEDDRLGGAPYVRFNETEFMGNATPDAVLEKCRELLEKETV